MTNKTNVNKKEEVRILSRVEGVEEGLQLETQPLLGSCTRYDILVSNRPYIK